MGNSKKNESLEAAIKKQNEQIEKDIFGNEENDKEYQDALNYIFGLIKEEIKNEYLVNGAILSCQMATGKDIEIDGIRFRGGNGSRTRLKVNRKGKISGKAKAIILDCKKEKNIFPFGNCLAELPDPVKEKLKNNQQARIEGTCKYLMWLEEKWENVFDGDNGSFCYEGNPELTMNSVLFCKRGGAFIYPLTSGQRITKYDYELIANQLTKEKILLMYKYQLTFDEYKISQDLELDENQLVIFMEMREYFKNEPSLKVGNVIFTFEGLGSYSGPTNSDHPNGQFGAIFIYCKDGEIVCMSDNCSTLPDHNETATIEDGIYDAVYWNHGKNKYSALQLRNYENVSDVYIPACYHDISNNNIVIKKNATGINMHAAGDLTKKPENPWSEGCLTISVKDYYDFGVKSGFIELKNDGKKYNTYDEIKLGLRTGNDLLGTHWGYVVVNREYMDENERERFLTGYIW